MKTLKKDTHYTLLFPYKSTAVIIGVRLEVCACDVDKEYFFTAKICGNNLKIQNAIFPDLPQNTYNVKIYGITPENNEIFIKQTQIKIS